MLFAIHLYMENAAYLSFVDKNFQFYPSCYLLRNKNDIDPKKLFDLLKNENPILRYESSTGKLKTKNVRLIRSHEVQIGGKNARFIFEFFRYENPPSFVVKDLFGNENSLYDAFIEEKFGYVLIIKIGGFIFLQKTGGMNTLTKGMKKALGLVGLNHEYRDRLLSGYDKLKKISMANIKNSPKEYESMDLEAENILDILPESDVVNFFPKSLKAGKLSDKKTMTINSFTGGIQFANQELENNLTGLIEFYSDQEALLSSSDPVVTNNIIQFQGYFPQKIESPAPESKPRYIKFMTGDVESHVRQNQENLSDQEALLDVLDDFNDYFELSEISSEEEGELKFKCVGATFPSDVSLELSYISDPKRGKNIQLEFETEDQDYKNILEIVKSEGFFKVHFDHETSYFEGDFYKIRSPDIGNIKPIVDATVPRFPDSVSSEKGLYSEYNDGENAEWSQNSIFFHVESYLKDMTDTKYVFCGDMGHEMADHIAFTANELIFVHGKAVGTTDSTNSVSALSELITQALKNLEHMDIRKASTKDEFLKLTERKRRVAPSITKRKPSGTVERFVSKHPLLKGEAGKFGGFLTEFLENQQFFSKRLVLALDFFTVDHLRSRLENYGNDPGFLDVQFLSAIGELRATCKRKGIEFEIWCK